jgi:hypothetical protein
VLTGPDAPLDQLRVLADREPHLVPLRALGQVRHAHLHGQVLSQRRAVGENKNKINMKMSTTTAPQLLCSYGTIYREGQPPYYTVINGASQQAPSIA